MMSPFGKNGQLHNYAIIFAISSIGTFLAFLWALFFINQQNDTKAFEENFGEKDIELESKKKIDLKVKQKYVHPLRQLFDFRNVKEIVRTCTKKRDNYVRAQIWLVILSMFCHLFVTLSPGSFLFQFVEKIYEWNAQTYAYISSVGTIAKTAVMMTITPIFIKVIIILFCIFINLKIDLYLSIVIYFLREIC